jgi:hypothetical protein
MDAHIIHVKSRYGLRGGAAQLQLPRPRVHYIMKRNSCNDTEEKPF